MKVVVTGGAGFIGSNIVGELLNKHEVIVIDNLYTGRIENLKNIIDEIEFVQGDIGDLDLLKSIFVDADTIFHQAAIPSVQRSMENPLLTNEANVGGVLSVLLAAKECGVRRVIYASSSSVYGDTPTLPKREDMKPNPKSPYAVSKLSGEYYCRVFSEVYGLSTIILRYFNVFGPKQDPNSEYSAVIPKFITRILQGKPPIIYGDGQQTRDFTFVGDIVKANILAMERDAKGVFNIAFGKRISINDLAKRIMDISGTWIDPIYEKPNSGDIRDSLADISAARKELGFTPDFDLNSGLEDTIKWFRTI